MNTTAAQELAFAWESVGMPLDTIAEMHIKLQELVNLKTKKLWDYDGELDKYL